MTMRYSFSTSAAISMYLLSATCLAGTAPAVSYPSARPICLDMAPAAPGMVGAWHERLELYLIPVTGKGRASVYSVHGILSGTQVTAPPFPVHTHPLSGTAALAPMNDRLGDGMQWQISLTGAAYGSDVNGSIERSGLVTENYTLQLDPQKWDGTLLGRKIFAPIPQNGEAFSAASDLALRRQVTRVNCTP